MSFRSKVVEDQVLEYISKHEVGGLLRLLQRMLRTKAPHPPVDDPNPTLYLLQWVTDADVARELPHLTTEQRAHAVNALLSGTRIQLVGEDLDNPRYRAMGREESIKYVFHHRYNHC